MSAPEIRIAYAPAGRETLSAVAEELVAEAADLAATVDFADADDSNSEPESGYSPLPSANVNRARAAYASGPEITVSHTPAGRETLAAISDELLVGEPPTGIRSTFAGEPEANADPQELELYEMVTFVARAADLEKLSQAERRELVWSRLAHRLPAHTSEDLHRIEITPWTVRGMLVLRVWCKVSPPES